MINTNTANKVDRLFTRFGTRRTCRAIRIAWKLRGIPYPWEPDGKRARVRHASLMQNSIRMYSPSGAEIQ